MFEVQIYRYHPELDTQPQMQSFQLEDKYQQVMVLDVLEHLKTIDTSLTYHRSCREGVCGSDGMNINGKNRLACVTPVQEVIEHGKPLILRPLPGMPVIRDLVVDMTLFFQQYRKIKPYLINDEPPKTIEHLQSPEER